MEASHIAAIFRKVSPFSLQKILPFSSSSSSSAARPRFSSFFSDDPDDGSSVYRHALKFQRPATIKRQEHLCNSVSLTGLVDLPVQRCTTRDGSFGVHTVLKVKASPKSDHTFKILLKMWDGMAQKSLQYLRQNDFVYVSGQLGSYPKVDDNGKLRIHYEVIVKDWNYVAQNCQHRKSEKLEPVENDGTDWEKKKKDQLYLWQVFFANPHEWWDNRQKKVHPRAPDFRQKDTGEALWLSSHDPPWVKKQLQLYDSRMAERRHQKHESAWSRMSKWVGI